MKKSPRPAPSMTLVSQSSLIRVVGGDGELYVERVKTSDKNQAAVLAFIKG